MSPSYSTDLCFHTLNIVFFLSYYVMFEAAWILNSKPGRRECSGQKILAMGYPFWFSYAVNYFAWQDLPGSE